MGTSGDNGQVTPGAAVPFGMVCVCPDNIPRQHGGYDYSQTLISGISINRLSGVGCSGGGGNLSILPAKYGTEVNLIKSSEKAFPGFYEVRLDNNVHVKLTATKNIAFQQYFFNDQASLTLDMASSFENSDLETSFEVHSDNIINGFIKARNVCGRGFYKLYYSIYFSKPFISQHVLDDVLQLNFNHNNIEVRIAVSPLSIDDASKRLLECSNSSFNSIKSQAEKAWDNVFNRFLIETNDEESKTIFYTSLYRSYLSPSNVSSDLGEFIGSDGEKYSSSYVYYGSWSLWDTFRTKFPLLVLTEPSLMKNVFFSLLHLYKTGKENWSTDHEPIINVRTEHSAILLLDAYRKGITDVDFRIGYKGIKKEAEDLLLDSPDHKLESVYDLWAIAQIAEIIGEFNDANFYSEKALSIFTDVWKKEFMIIKPDFIVMKNNGLYQGTRWQYRWAAPQYLDMMVQWCGKDTLLNQLDYFFTNNLYNQGNEPDIHVPFLFNRFGAPEKSQSIVRNLLLSEMVHKYGGNSEFETPYMGKAFKNSPVGYSPEMDEDDGTMSAWYIFSSIGMYPMLVGSDQYELVSPIFDKITINLENGIVFSILTKGRKSINDPIKSIYLNGELVEDYILHHKDIVKGGVLLFVY